VTLWLLIALGVVVAVAVVVAAARARSSSGARGGARAGGGCAYPGFGDPIDPKNRPKTPAAPGFPPTFGFKGEWDQAESTLRAQSRHTFAWKSYFETPAGDKDEIQADGREIIFRLFGCEEVQIASIVPTGKIADDARSAYGCCGRDGLITLELFVDSGVDPAGEQGYIYGIDPPRNDKGESRGQRADYEVVPFS
jgi:hypothetical protein